MAEFSHIESKSKNIKIVDVGAKNITHRLAVARGSLRISDELKQKLSSDEAVRENIFTVAKVAAAMAAKKTPELIPMAHSIGIDSVETEISLKPDNRIDIQSAVSINSKTGVEMEALTAVSTAALTVYDMCKSVDKKMVIEKIGLYKKTGGKSGNFINEDFARENDQ